MRLLRDSRFINNIWYEKYKAARAEYKTKIIQAKRISWRNFCSNLESSKDISKTLKALANKPIKGISLLNHEGTESSSPEEAVDILLKAHFPEMKTHEGEEQQNGNVDSPVKTNEKDESDVENYITKEKVRTTLKTFGNQKSPGPDELKPVI